MAGLLLAFSVVWFTAASSSASERQADESLQVTQLKVPEKYARFYGVWSGGKWGGKMTGSLIVNSIDENGGVWVTYGHGAYSRWGIHAPGAWPMRGSIEGSELRLNRTSRGAKIHYELSGDTLRGVWRKGANTSKIELKKDETASRSISETPWAGFQKGLKPGESSSPVKAPLPDDVVISAPSGDVAPERRTYSGIWHGWMCRDAICDAKLAVESVSNEGATIVYAFGSEKKGAASERLVAEFVDDELRGRFKSGSLVTYRLRPDGNLDVMWRNQTGDWGAGILTKVQ